MKPLTITLCLVILAAALLGCQGWDIDRSGFQGTATVDRCRNGRGKDRRHGNG